MAGKKILVADDSLTIQKVIRLALSGDGYDIQTVSTGKDALEQASLFRPDICIIDVSLPQYDAYQIKEQFNSKPDLKSIPVILMSSAFEKVDEARARGLGFSGHLIKPFDPSHLRSTLLSVAEQSGQKLSAIEAIVSEPPPAPISLNPPQFEAQKVDEIQKLTRETFAFSEKTAAGEWGIMEPEVDAIEIEETPQVQQTPGHAATSTPLVSVSQRDLEAMVKKEVNHYLNQISDQLQNRFEQELKNYSYDVLPSLAEKVIKEEIHKLLSDPPV